MSEDADTRESVDPTIAGLTRQIEQQRLTIAALVAAAERRLDQPAEDSAFARWEQNIALHQVIEERTAQSRSAERLVRSVLDSLEGRLCILAADGTVLGTNRVWDEAIVPGVPAVRTGGNFFDLIQSLGVDGDGHFEELVRSILDGRSRHASVKGRWEFQGVVEHVVVRVQAVRDHESARGVVTVVDITEAMQTQEELHRLTERAQLLALVAEHTDNAVVIQDAEGRIEWVNDAFCRLTGYTREEVTGRHRVDLWHGPYTRTPAFAALRSAIAAGRAVDVELPAETRDGGSYWTHLQIQPIESAGRITRFVGIERDTTQARLAAEQLRATHQQVKDLAEALTGEKAILAGVLASIPHLVYWKDRDLRYAGVNQAFLALRRLGDQADVVERTEAELAVHDELSDVLDEAERKVLASGLAQYDRHVTITSSEGRRRNLLLSVLPHRDHASQGGGSPEIAGLIGVAADVTHIGELERQLAQASRLESIGQLAAGIAHEINTPVQYVSDNTRFVADTVAEVLAALTTVTAVAVAEADPAQAMQSVRDAVGALDLDFLGEELPNALAESLEGLQRVSQIVRAMKDFSHPGAGRAAVDLNRAVESTSQVCRNEWRYVADLQLDLDPDMGTVPCFEGELKQVLLNIIVNAAQAIGEAAAPAGSGPPLPRGLITVSTHREQESARIVVTDNGPGMEEAVRARIFDPFFTTKEVGKGTGQGLSMAYASIVQKHGGQLQVSSAPGRGSTFTVILPLAVGEL